MGSGEGAGGEVEARMGDAVDQILAAAGTEEPAGASTDAPVPAPANDIKQEPHSGLGDAPSLGVNEWSADGRSTGDDSGAQRGYYGGPQAQVSGGGGSGGTGGLNAFGRKRTPRQQEQNKHAQQRYRARRKAQFEELQDAVAVLTAQIKSMEAERQVLHQELAQARSSPAAAPSTAANVLGIDPAALAGAPETVQILLKALQAQGALPAAPAAPPVHAPAPAPAQPPAAEVQEMMRAFGQEVWSFMSSQDLLQAPPAAAAPQSATALIKMGLELVSLVLNASGADAQTLLHDGAPPGLPCAADDPQRWATVVTAVALTPQQVARVALWRAQFLSQLDARYGERVALKTKGLQALDNSGTASDPHSGTQWAETLLLTAAGSSGVALAAQADAELENTARALLKNVADNRAATIAAVKDLLTAILTPTQAIRYLAASHPFMWNGLAFAHAVTSKVTSDGVGRS